MSAEIPSQEPKPRPPRKRAPKPVSTRYNNVLDEYGFLGGSRELDKAHIKALDAAGCGCTNTHETVCITVLFRAGITDPKTLFYTYKRYSDLEGQAHQKYIEDGFKKPSRIAEEILVFENKKKQ